MQARKQRARAHVWTRGDDLQLLRMMAAKKVYGEICATMGLNYNQVVGRKYTLRLEAQCFPAKKAYLEALLEMVPNARRYFE
mgnify:CR=1 FL=1